MSDVITPTLEDLVAAEARSMAFAYMSEAFAEATLDGLDIDAVAEAAFCAAFRELVAVYGEERATRIAQTLPERIQAGEFSAPTRQ
jgi:hypothetical protein